VWASAVGHVRAGTTSVAELLRVLDAPGAAECELAVARGPVVASGDAPPPAVAAAGATTPPTGVAAVAPLAGRPDPPPPRIGS